MQGNLREADCPLVSISSYHVLQLGNEARELLDFKKTFDTVLHDPKAIAVEHGNYSSLWYWLTKYRTDITFVSIIIIDGTKS